MKKNQKPPKTLTSETYRDALGGLTILQQRFVVARIDKNSDAEAARYLGIEEKTPFKWPEKKLIDEIVAFAVFDGVELALSMRRKALPRAMAVKMAALESDSEKIRQDAATELIEWELGKAKNTTDVSGNLGVTVLWTPHKPKLP